jgi:hypothetical protein
LLAASDAAGRQGSRLSASFGLTRRARVAAYGFDRVAANVERFEMPFAGTFAPALVGEMKGFRIDFVNDIAAGDTLQSATATLECFYGSDPNAAGLVAPGPPRISGTLVSQMLGWGPGFSLE